MNWRKIDDIWKGITDAFAICGTGVLGFKLLRRLLIKLIEEDY